MSDTNNDSGSVAKVAFDLMKYLKAENNSSYGTEEEILGLYRRCYKAAAGNTLSHSLKED